MRQILRVMVALCALAALSGGGTVAFADHGSGGSSGSGSGDEHGGQGHQAGDDNGGQNAGDDNARHDAGDDRGAKPQPGDDRGVDNGPGKAADNRTADVYTLAEPQHGNPEGVAFDKRSGFFFVSATGDGSIYRGRLGDTATPVPVFIPRRRRPVGHRPEGRSTASSTRPARARGRSRSTTSTAARCWRRSTPRAATARRPSSTTSTSPSAATSTRRTPSARRSTT